MLMDCYNQNNRKDGYISIFQVNDMRAASKHLAKNDNPDLYAVHGIDVKYQGFAPEVNFLIENFYVKEPNVNRSLSSKNISALDVENHTIDYFYEYRKQLAENNIKDIERSPGFLQQTMINDRAYEVFYEHEKNTDRLLDRLQQTELSCIKDIPSSFVTFDNLIKVDYLNPRFAYPHLPDTITGKQMAEFINKDSKSDNNSLRYCINSVPDKLKSNELTSELHKMYDKGPLKDELAFALVTSGMEVNTENAKKAMEYFSSKRFVTEYDPCGADDSWGRICGCDYYINSRMSNPAEKFEANLLSIKEWHDIASKDTRMIEFIPKSVIDNESFWDNYKDFIGKGGYLNHPENEYKMDNFDEYMVFAKMPERLITNPEICRDLLRNKVISIDFISNPTEELYRLTDPKDYQRIPVELREKDSFKDVALAAFEKDKWNITEIPEKFITKEMVSSALSYDMELADRVPIHFLSEDLLIDKIKTSNHQGAFRDWAKSGEHPNCIELEISNHKTVLQYIPKELRTDKVCQEAINANPKNAKFVSDRYKKNMTAVAHNVNTGKQDKTEKAGSQIKNNCVTIKRKGLKM